MCIAIEYLINGRPQLVYMDSRDVLPVLVRGGDLRLYKWGSTGSLHRDGNTPGWLGKFPEGTHVPLEHIRASKWMSYDPAPVRIVASRF
jgi:hypothetical protein